MSTQFSPASASCDAMYLSRAVVRTAAIGLALVFSILLMVAYLLHSPASISDRHAGTAHFSSSPDQTLSPHQQLSYSSRL